MREYICKDILLDVIERNTLWNTNEAFEGLIKNIQTITKADICKGMVSEETVKQFIWERDVAIHQLKDLGIGFGEKKTKSDICREFFEELRSRMYQGRDTSYQGMCDFGYELLEEMEQELGGKRICG